jgi:nitroreductase/Pyruvate/2-oxoacid:ferredoxin oxidoreductase delta subunit
MLVIIDIILSERFFMSLLIVNKETCTRCNACIDVCPVSIIAMGEEVPQVTFDACIACGHCVAVCPTSAIDNTKAPLTKQKTLPSMPVINSETAELFLRSRRSVRSYKDQPVQREELTKLLDIARFAPTGGNSQGISYLVIDKKESLKDITEIAICYMEEEVAKNTPWAVFYSPVVKRYRTTKEDVILRDAPALIVAKGSTQNLMAKDSTRFTLEYVELYAPSMGLATCWAGFISLCVDSGYKPMLDYIKLPEGQSITGALMVGYSKHIYKRAVDRAPLDVSFAN